MNQSQKEKVAILIPCYNEEATIKKVINDFQKEIPSADIYVYDNNSTDKTESIALAEGAIVRKEWKQGKGNVVRTMFRDIEADYYIMVDGDDTYPSEYVHDLLKPLQTGRADMVIGDRLSNGTYSEENKRAFHDLGNNLVKGLINKLYSSNINDIMTGYRGFNKFFVKSFPVLSSGFEIETELTIHTLDKRFNVVEIPIIYRDRPEGSESKLNTFSDGYKVLKMIFSLFKNYKPMLFFNIISAVFVFLGIIVGIPVIQEFINYSYVYKVPSAILSVGLIIVGLLLFSCGIILDTVDRNHRATFEFYLNDLKEKLRK